MKCPRCGGPAVIDSGNGSKYREKPWECLRRCGWVQADDMMGQGPVKVDPVPEMIYIVKGTWINPKVQDWWNTWDVKAFRNREDAEALVAKLTSNPDLDPQNQEGSTYEVTQLEIL